MLALSISHARYAALDACGRPIRSLARDAAPDEGEAPHPALRLVASLLDGEAVVVLADYWMPNMDGAELLRSILQDGALASKHACALMTACAGWLPLPLHDLLAQYDVQILAKPFRLAELEEIVRRCAARD